MDYKKMKDEKFSIIYIYNSDNTNWVDGMMFSRIEKLSKEYRGAKFYPLDVKTNPEVAGEFLVFVTPVLIIYSKGKEILRKIRFFPMDEIKYNLDIFMTHMWSKISL